MTKGKLFWFGLVLSTVGTVLFFGAASATAPEGRIPLGIPGEWTWQPIPLNADTFPDLAWGWMSAAIGFLIYGGLAWCGAHRFWRGARRLERAVWLTAATLAAFLWVGLVQEAPPEGYRLSKVAWVLYYPRSSGYFYQARYEMRDPSAFLAGYEAKMAEGDVLHIGTHPPGLFLFHYGLIQLCRRSPLLTDVLLATRPASAEAASAIVAEHARQSGRAVLGTDEAALWLAALLTQFLAVATLLPLYGLLRMTHSVPTSWMTCLFWPLVPAVAVFLPKSDALYPFLGTLAICFWLQGLSRRSTWGGAVLAGAAGLMLWLGMFLSLAFLPVALLAGVLGLGFSGAAAARGGAAPISLHRPSDRRVRGRSVSAPFSFPRLALCAASAIVAFLLPVVMLWIGYGINLFNVWAWNYRNHAAFYDQFHRTWWKWLLVNPVELGFAVGWPVMVLVVCAFVALLRAARRTAGPLPRGETSASEAKNEPAQGASPPDRRHVSSWFSLQSVPYWCCAAVWGLLWLSGKNSGEAARLWLVIMPWLIWLAAGCRAVWPVPAAEHPSGVQAVEVRQRAIRLWSVLLAAEALVSIATVTLVSGFHY